MSIEKTVEKIIGFIIIITMACNNKACIRICINFERKKIHIYMRVCIYFIYNNDSKLLYVN